MTTTEEVREHFIHSTLGYHPDSPLDNWAGEQFDSWLRDRDRDLLQEIWDITDGEFPIPPEAVERIAAEYGINLRPACDTCHKVDGHTTDCADGICHTCNRNPCQCDNLYELAVGK